MHRSGLLGKRMFCHLHSDNAPSFTRLGLAVRKEGALPPSRHHSRRGRVAMGMTRGWDDGGGGGGVSVGPLLSVGSARRARPTQCSIFSSGFRQR